jgi:hypothetical protein
MPSQKGMLTVELMPEHLGSHYIALSELTIRTVDRYAAIRDRHARIVAVHELSAAQQVQGRNPRRIGGGF